MAFQAMLKRPIMTEFLGPRVSREIWRTHTWRKESVSASVSIEYQRGRDDINSVFDCRVPREGCWRALSVQNAERIGTLGSSRSAGRVAILYPANVCSTYTLLQGRTDRHAQKYQPVWRQTQCINR